MQTPVVDTTENLNNPSILSQLFPDEVLKSVYWNERGIHHRKLIDRGDKKAVNDAINAAAALIKEADAILVVTGAGIGVDMGLPDFRSSNKFWEELQHLGISRYEDSSNNALFESEPDFAWGLNYHQMQMYRTAEVHDGYKALLNICNTMKGGNYFCFTTNIDGVLQRAGFDISKIREVHGNIHRLQCTSSDCKNTTGKSDAWEVDSSQPLVLSYDPKTMVVNTVKTPLPKCPHCTNRLSRPNVWFCKDTQYVYWKYYDRIIDDYFKWMENFEQLYEEEKDMDAARLSEEKCHSNNSGLRNRQKKRMKVVVIEVGAGLVIPSARVEAEDAADRLGASLIRINPTDFMVPIPDTGIKHVGIPLGASEALVRIHERMQYLDALSL